MKFNLILIVGFALINSWTVNKAMTNTNEPKNKTGIDTISDFKLKFCKPNNWWWYADEKRTANSYIINFVKQKTYKKELSILISTSPWEDITNESVQQKFIQMFPTLDRIDEKLFMDSYGVNSFVFKGLTKIKDNHIYSILAYENGFKYQIVLTCYLHQVDTDDELIEILKCIQIYK